MTEMTHSSENHRHSKSVSGGDDLLVTNRASGLDYRGSSGFGDLLDSIGEREKGVRCGHSTLEREHRFRRTQAAGVYPAHLSRSDADCLTVASVDNRV